MSLLDGEPAVASVTAASQLRCLYVPRADFLQMLASHAAVGSSVVRLLVQRLRDADRRVAATAADPLTGLSNRLGLEQQCRREGGRLARYGGSLAVLFADVDKFKAINDTFGHPAGDDVLRLVADSLRRSLRASDFAARFGGDEFVALLPDTDAGGARLLADRFRDDLDALTDLPVPMSVSIGLRDMHIPPLELSDADETSFPEQLDQRASDVNGRLAEIMGAADKAMYESKARQRAGAQASGPQHD
ncbi:MAG: hypothetical protein CL878_04090 [Dehalococcoidia bacterium]|nr:hypothetical protein [Dehalococcoidia bacterium]